MATIGRSTAGAAAYLVIAYAAVLPSLVAYLLFNRGIELIGAGRAGQSTHLMPLFGSLLAVVFRDEQFHAYHLIGIALIGAGIVLASVQPRAERGRKPVSATGKMSRTSGALLIWPARAGETPRLRR